MRASAEAELENTKNSIAFSESELTEAKHRLQQLGSKLNETALQEVDDINIELPEVKQRIRTLEHRLAQLTIKATFAGEVNGLELKAGSVIAPGEKLMEIIPKGSDLLVVAQVNTKEIGHLSVGDPVKIKVMTYDYARYGSIDGTLQKISAGTFKNEEGFPFYKIWIKPKIHYVGDNKKKQIKTGMTVQAETITGRKTILQYLLKPIYNATNTSFSER